MFKSMFTGRIGRLGYFLGHVYIFLIALLFTVFLMIWIGKNATSYIVWLTYALGLLSVPVSVGLMARRWHDLNETGWLSLLGFIPIVSFLVGLVLLFIRGTAGPNKYGNPVDAKTFKEVLFGAKPASQLPPPPVPKQPVEGQF